MYVTKESFMDEFIWKIFKNLGLGIAFSCILEVLLFKIFPATARNLDFWKIVVISSHNNTLVVYNYVNLSQQSPTIAIYLPAHALASFGCI